MRRTKIFLTAIVIGVSVLAADVQAQNTQFPVESPSMNRRVRNLGMGNVGVSLRGTHDASPFYNPAGLNDLEEGKFTFLDLTAEISKGAVDLLFDTKDFVNEVDDASTGAERTAALDSFAQERIGEFNRFRLAVTLLSYARRNFAAGILLDERFDLSVRDQSFYTHVDFRNLGDVGAYVSGAYGFWDKLLQLGVSLRPTVRFSLDEADQNVTFADVTSENASGDPVIVDQFKKIKDRRFDIGVDVGLKSNLALPVLKDLKVYEILKPQVGFSWNDMGSPRFGAAPGNLQTMNIGFSVHPDIGKFKNTFAFDVRELNKERNALAKLHFGAETIFDWVVDLGLRAGVNQGYFTAGATVDLRYFKVEGAYYQEEVGRRTRQDGDTRFAVNLAFSI